MASIKDLRRRIVSTKNTQQTTKAMKMVSAAKLRRSQEAIVNQRPYAKGLGELMIRVASLSNVTVSSPLVLPEGAGGEKAKRVTLVLVTSDRGLCGGFNGNIIKAAQRWLANEGRGYESVELQFVGRKGNEFFKTRKVNRGRYHQEISGKVTFAKAKKLSEDLAQHFVDGQTDEVKLIYNEFKNAVSQKVVVEDYLPVRGSTLGLSSEGSSGTPPPIVRPSANELFDRLLKKHFAIQAFRVLLESQASEHGARMSAMENATKNAGEMIRHLTLAYNRQRQAGITKELLEIIGGSEAQKAG